MPETRVDLEVLCTCGEELEFSNKWAGSIIVSPCSKCAEVKYDEGYAVAEKEFA